MPGATLLGAAVFAGADAGPLLERPRQAVFLGKPRHQRGFADADAAVGQPFQYGFTPYFFLEQAVAGAFGLQAPAQGLAADVVVGGGVLDREQALGAAEVLAQAG